MANGIKTVHNKLLGGWFNVRGPHQSPIGGRYDSKAAAQAALKAPASAPAAAPVKRKYPNTGINYTARSLPGGKFGIVVRAFVDGRLDTEDLNLTPYPHFAAALAAAKQAAEAASQQCGLPVVGEV